MPPIPCSHCGNNFMRRTPLPSASMLCNCCEIKEEVRNPKGPKMEKVSILIRCTLQDQVEIEEFCVNEGLDFSEYFMNLHNQAKLERIVPDIGAELGREEAEEKQEKKMRGAKK